MISSAMEILEMVGWISLGFIPSYVAHKVGSHKLARRISARQFLTVGGKE
jgi:hypothetical protein